MTDEFGIKGATVTIGGTEAQAKIVSEVTVSGGETDENIVSAMDGTNYTFLGNQGNFNIEFDAMVEDESFFEYAFGTGTSGGTKTTVVFENDASTTNDIVIDMGTNADTGAGVIYYFSSATGFNATPKFPFGEGNIVSMKFSCTPALSSVEYDTSP
jgi:hypothetical protein